MALTTNLMGTGVVAPPTIPKCAYLVRIGEEPRADFSNIEAWTPDLAKRVKEFEELKGGLPKSPEAVTAEQRIAKIHEAFDQCKLMDMRADGFPKLEVIREKAKMPELETEEIRYLWFERKKLTKEKEKE